MNRKPTFCVSVGLYFKFILSFYKDYIPVHRIIPKSLKSEYLSRLLDFRPQGNIPIYQIGIPLQGPVELSSKFVFVIGILFLVSISFVSLRKDMVCVKVCHTHSICGLEKFSRVGYYKNLFF